MINAREEAYKILYDIKYGHKYSNIRINEIFKRGNFNHEMRGFITYLVYGVMSNINYLDYFIRENSSIAFSKISKKIKLILEIAFFELIFMNSSANYASVNEAVKLASKYDNRGKAFVNAVLRKFSDDENIKNARNYTFDEIKDDTDYISVRYSVSKDIAERLIKNYCKDFVENLLLSMSKSPDIFIRGNRLKTSIKELVSNLEELKLNYTIIDSERMIISVRNFKDIAENKAYNKGMYSIQDYASMQAVSALEVKEGEKVLDICSAPGGKSVMIAELMNNKGSVLSLDISRSKLDLLNEQCRRLGIDIIKTDVSDGTIYNLEYKESFDKVLCDVPCSGIGILRRKPEIRYKSLDSNLIKIQKLILKNASGYLRHGGILVYSTCTLGKEENANVIEEFISENNNFSVVSSKEYYPHTDKTDGFFVCKMMKK